MGEGGGHWGGGRTGVMGREVELIEMNSSCYCFWYVCVVDICGGARVGGGGS